MRNFYSKCSFIQQQRSHSHTLKSKAFNYGYCGAIAFTLCVGSSTAELRELYLSKRNLSLVLLRKTVPLRRARGTDLNESSRQGEVWFVKLTLLLAE
ncbi:hypothetical protein [Nostoc sp. NZL]|uniref:hypothetical protein n=1 Tax=Nostoc sp. NZL TaxID=2650612 RepID=UPI0018C4567E|nr:hypothetical protein [Nostoc sp. NZL]MBG1240824.1 aminopeptidase P family protein [Nostoc sp. NZL]